MKGSPYEAVQYIQVLPLSCPPSVFPSFFPSPSFSPSFLSFSNTIYTIYGVFPFLPTECPVKAAVIVPFEITPCPPSGIPGIHYEQLYKAWAQNLRKKGGLLKRLPHLWENPKCVIALGNNVINILSVPLEMEKWKIKILIFWKIGLAYGDQLIHLLYHSLKSLYKENKKLINKKTLSRLGIYASLG